MGEQWVRGMSTHLIPRSGRGSRGSATAELAVVLPAVMVLLGVLLLGLSMGIVQVRLEEGARAGARALARGDSPGQVMEIVARVSGDSVSVALDESGEYGTVTVTGHERGALSWLVPWTQTAQAIAKVESVSGVPKPVLLLTVESRFSTNSAVNGETIRKSSLWRWARSPACPLRNGQCEAVATGRTGIRHAQQ